MAAHAQLCKRLHTSAPPVFSLKLYRALRPFVGPVLAWACRFRLEGCSMTAPAFIRPTVKPPGKPQRAKTGYV